jgi:hypothetical protein
MIRYFYLAATVIIGLTCTARIINAQSLEPRAYSNAPTGMNFVLAGFQISSRVLLFDPSLPITDADAQVDLAFFGYARTLDVAGKLAKIVVIIPYASLATDGFIDDEFRSRDNDGPGDPALYFSYNFYGAPALSLKEFKTFQPTTVSGFTFKLTAPLGATYFTGGRTTIAGIDKHGLQQNWRTGFTLALPVDRYHSIKLYGSSGISQRTGNNYDALGLVWQFRWGAGL